MIAFEIGPEPVWAPCADCGKETMQPRCWDCAIRHDRDNLAREVASRCELPTHFGWAIAGTSALAERVKHPKLGFDQLANRIRASKNLIIAGPTGAGKTSLAVAMLRERVPHCLFAPASKLGAFGEYGDALRSRAERAKVLLIDDLGKDAQTANQYLIGVIDTRHNASLSTWITTGLSVGQIEARYDHGTRRRIVDEATRIMLGDPGGAGAS